MSITSAIVLYAVAWFMTFLVILPLRLKTQGDVGQIIAGTQAGAPADGEVQRIKVKALITTGIAAVIWAVLYLTITQGWITVHDFDFNGIMPPVTEHAVN